MASTGLRRRVRPARPITVKTAPPRSDVSVWVGLAGLAGLFAWIMVCRHWPMVADTLGIPGPRMLLDGPYAAVAAMVFTSGPMIAVSLSPSIVMKSSTSSSSLMT